MGLRLSAWLSFSLCVILHLIIIPQGKGISACWKHMTVCNLSHIQRQTSTFLQAQDNMHPRNQDDIPNHKHNFVSVDTTYTQDISCSNDDQFLSLPLSG